MNEERWELVYKANGQLEAEMLRGLLEAQGISVFLTQEGAGHAFGLTVGPLGLVQVLVPASQVEQARQVLQDYESGEEARTTFPDQERPDDDQLDDNLFEEPLDKDDDL